MKAYPKYKDSGIEWIGKIPEGWGENRLKYIAAVQPSSVDKKSLENEDNVFLCNYMDVYKNEFITSALPFMVATANLNQIEKFEIEKNDVLVTKDSETPEDIANAAFVKDDLDNVLCGYHLTQIKTNPELLLGEYLFRLFGVKRFHDLFSVSANGITRFGLTTYSFSNRNIILPPLPEQTQIANYLDHKTKLIDTLIEKKQKQIKLLKEQRTAIINQAVTKGLDPNVKMKNSGIEWLGEIPESWEVVKLKYVVDSVKTGLTPPTSVQKYYNDATFNWFSPGDFNDGMKLLRSKRKINEKALDEGKARFFRKHSVLLVGIGATLGKVGIIEDHGSSNQQIIAITFTDDFDAYFGAYYLKSISDVIIRMSNFATLPIFNQTQAKDIFIVTPPLREQKSVIGFIFKVENQTTTYIDKIQQQINLLKEYRTTLISEAVTGKIDVREHNG